VSEDPDWVEEINGIYDDRKANAPCFDVMLRRLRIDHDMSAIAIERMILSTAIIGES
jgi:hypothetical protein